MVFSGTQTGIVFAIISVVAAVLVFVLVKIASSLKRSGGFDITIKRIGLLDSHEFRFNLEFENTSKSDRSFNGLCLSYFLNGELTQIAEMVYQPIARGFDLGFVTQADGRYGFLVERGKSQSAVIDFLLPDSFSLPKGARVCLSCTDENKRVLYAFVDLKSEEAKLLAFKKLKK